MANPVSEQEAVKTAEVAGYKLGKFLGVGGMGTVYIASRDGVDYAFKLLNPDKEPISFEREVAANAKLDHPGIAKILEYDLSGERPFIVREFRPDYFPLNPKADISLESLCKLGMGIARPLVYSYSQGVVHGDIKPSNIMVNSDYDVMLTDFGLAKFQRRIVSVESFESSDSAQAESDLFTASQTRKVAGTLRYLSPEQRKGEPATEQSDIYSLNSVLFEILTKNIPGVDARTLLSRTGTPSDLSEILIKGLNSLEDRYGKMGNWLKDMEKYMEINAPKDPSGLLATLGNGAWATGAFTTKAGLYVVGGAAYCSLTIAFLGLFLTGVIIGGGLELLFGDGSSSTSYNINGEPMKERKKQEDGQLDGAFDILDWWFDIPDKVLRNK